jgi:hypothetical protein
MIQVTSLLSEELLQETSPHVTYTEFSPELQYQVHLGFSPLQQQTLPYSYRGGMAVVDFQAIAHLQPKKQGKR